MEAADRQNVYSCFERIIIFSAWRHLGLVFIFFNYKTHILQRSETMDVFQSYFPLHTALHILSLRVGSNWQVCKTMIESRVWRAELKHCTTCWSLKWILCFKLLKYNNLTTYFSNKFNMFISCRQRATPSVLLGLTRAILMWFDNINQLASSHAHLWCTLFLLRAIKSLLFSSTMCDYILNQYEYVKMNEWNCRLTFAPVPSWKCKTSSRKRTQGVAHCWLWFATHLIILDNNAYSYWQTIFVYLLFKDY